MTSSTTGGKQSRNRSGSFQQVVDYISNPPRDHHLVHLSDRSADPSSTNVPLKPEQLATGIPNGNGTATTTTNSSLKTKRSKKEEPELERRNSIVRDLLTFGWLKNPRAALVLIIFTLSLWFLIENLPPSLKPPTNPLSSFIFISYPLPPSSEDGLISPRYGKGLKDLLFIGWGVILLSLYRQGLVEWVIIPCGKRWGIKTEGKMQRFTEQGTALFYFGVSSPVGMYVMSRTPTWWYQTSEFWIGYPHWRMDPYVKAYYLIQSAYWVQQSLVMLLGLEKPRSDFKELIAHHFVTLWMIGWSYGINLTMIGVAVYVTMDTADVWLSAAKLLNYLKLEKTSTTIFSIFLGVWTYFRIYLNIWILWSVWYEFDLIPDWTRQFTPKLGVWLTWWMKYQIFVPILLLLFLNLFWYYLMWRIAIRTLKGNPVRDSREEDSDEEEDEDQDGKAKKE